MKQALAAVAKRAATSSFLIDPLTDVADRWLGSRGCLVTFHRAAPTQNWETLPNRDFYLDLGFLDRFLSHLKQDNWDIVTVDEALRRAGQGGEQGRYINFSIDDCYRDTYEQVVPLFRYHGVPVTLFVTTGIPDGTLPLWAAGLEDTLLARPRIALEDRTIDVATTETKRAAFETIAAAWDGPDAGRHYSEFCRRNGVDEDAMHWKHAISWDMLAELSGDPLVEIGAHTVSHARISSLAPAEARAELQGSRDRLMQRLGLPIRHFAFPYGRSGDCGPRDFAIAREAGFSSVSTTSKGLLRNDAFALPRNTINGAHRSITAMKLHLSGLSGAAARMTGRV